MQVATSSNFFHPIPHIESVRRLAKKGLDGIELICEYPDDIAYFTQPQNLSTLLSLKDDYGIEYFIHAPWGDTNAASPNEGVRRATVDDWKRSIDFAHRLGSPLVTVHLGHRYTLESTDTAIGRAIKSVEEAAPMAQDAEIWLSVENTGQGASQLFRNADDIVDIWNNMQMPFVGMTFDIGHAFLQGLDICECLERMALRLTHVHIHDNLGQDDDHLPLGTGGIDLASALGTLREISYDQSFGIELAIRSYRPEVLTWSINYLREAYRD